MNKDNSEYKKTASEPKLSLLDIRDGISELDERLLDILAKRRKFSLAVAKAKQSINKPLRDQDRERELLESLIKEASVLGLDSRYITKVFTTIIEDSVRYQQEYLQSLITPDTKSSQKKSIAVLGGKGAYSYLAANKFFSSSENQYTACATFREIIDNVENGNAEYGVIPIENTTTGGITEVYDLLLQSKLSIIGEEKFRINHCLVARAGIQLTDIRSIVAHPQAGQQCSENVAKLLSAKIRLVESTAHALEIAADESIPDTAAISSEQAADLFGLKVLKKNLANQNKNYTRFLVLAKNAIKVSPSVQCKTTIALSTGQKPGSLAQVLTLFQSAQIPLSKLESRPIPEKAWEQMFYIDLEGNIGSPHVAATISSLTDICRYLRIFGSYPTDDISATQVSPGHLANASLARDNFSRLTSEVPNTLTTTKITDNNVINLDGNLIGDGQFVVIAQPSTIESQAQINRYAKHASESGINLLNVGPHGLSSVKTELSKSHRIELLHKACEFNNLSIISEIKNLEEIENSMQIAAALKVHSSCLLDYSLLETIGKLDVPILLCCDDQKSLKPLFKAAQFVRSQGNLQVVVCLSGLSSIQTGSKPQLDLHSIIEIKQHSQLSVIVDLTDYPASSEHITPLSLAVKAAGADGILINFGERQNEESDCLEFNQVTQLMSDLYPC